MVSQPQFVSLSHKLKDLYNDAKRGSDGMQEEICTSFKTTFTGHESFNDQEYKNVCKITIHYITELKTKKLDIAHGCKYLYNMISDELIKTVQESTDDFTFYKNLLNAYCSYLDDPDIDINNIKDFSKQVFKKHEHLVNLYNNLEKMHPSTNCDAAKDFFHLYKNKMVECIGVTNDDFCDELDRFKQDYEFVMRDKSCVNAPKHLPSIHDHNNLVSIIIPVSATIIASIVLFTMYKFTPFGSLIRPSKKRTKKNFRGMYVEENPIIHKNEGKNRNTKNISYNIAYNSV